MKVALHYACNWEESLIEAYDGVDWKESPVEQCIKNINEFKKLYNKLVKKEG